MKCRTDLVSEIRKGVSGLKGTECYTKFFGDVTYECVEILDSEGEKGLGRPIGKYITLESERFDKIIDYNNLKTAFRYALSSLLPEICHSIMVVGLGNCDITPDALGPMCASDVFVTRHITKELRKSLGLVGLRDVSVVIPGVLGKTGIESAEIVKGAVNLAKPSALIVVDALAASSHNRLCSTIQLSDTGIRPGSGVNNSRKEFSSFNFGVPVIAVGVPTVIDFENSFMVTPKEIDLLIKKSSEIISQGLNAFLQPEIDEEVILNLS